MESYTSRSKPDLTIIYSLAQEFLFRFRHFILGAGSRNFIWKGAKDNVSAQSSLQMHNELHAFYKEKNTYWKMLKPIGAES